MSDFFSLLITAGCLGLYTLAFVVNGRGTRNLAALLCWSSLGVIPAVIVVGLGTGLAAGLRPRTERRMILLRAALTGLALAISAGAAALLGVWPPVREWASSSTLLWMGAALVAGFATGQIGEALLTHEKGLTFTPGALAVDVTLILVALFLPPAVYSSGIGLFVAVVALLALMAWYRQAARTAQATLEQRTHEITLLTSLGQFTSENLNLDEVLWKIYEHVIQLIDLSIFYIVIYDEERQMLEFRLVVADGKRLDWRPRKAGESTADYVMRHRQPVHITASQRGSSPEIQEFTPTIPFKDYLGVPLLVGTKVIGVMSVLSIEREDAFGDEQILMLQTIAHQVSLAVRNAMLYTRQTELIARLSRINESASQVLFGSHRDSALEAACQMAQAISGASKVAIFLSDHDRLSLKTSVGLTDRHRSWLKSHPPAIPEDVRLIASIREQEDAALREMTISGEFQSLAEFPLRSGRVAQGMLAVYHDMPYAFRQQDIDLLVVLAGQITAMLENVQLFDIMEQYAAEMSQLVQLSRISTSSLDMTAVVCDIADMLRQMTEVNRVAIVSFEASTRQARLLAVVNGGAASAPGGFLTPFPELMHLMGDDDPAAVAYQHTDSGLSPALAQQMAENHEQTLALVPLAAHDAVLGAVLLGSQDTRRFEAREWQFIEMATHQIAAQINNIRLHDRLQQDLNRRLAQVGVVEDIAQQVSSSLDFNQVIERVMEAAIQATDASLALLALVTDSDHVWVIEHRSEHGQTYLRYRSRDRDSGLIGRILRESQAVIIADQQAALAAESEGNAAYASSLGVPLVKGENVMGALIVESQQPNNFNVEHAIFLTSLAGHAVTSIENARFLEERQHEIDLLRSLRDLSLWLVSADDMRSVGHEILETALQLMAGRQAAMYEYDSETDQFDTIASFWFAEQESLEARETLPLAMAREAVRTGQLVHAVDVRAHPGVSADSFFDYGSAVAVPLKHAREVHYVMLLTFEGHRRLIERDLNTLDLLASQAVGHLENARLHERIRAARDQMRVILDSTRSGLILLDRNVCLIQVNASAQRLLGIDLSASIGDYFPDALYQHVDESGDDGYTRDKVAELVETLRAHPEQETLRELRRQTDNRWLRIEEAGLPVRGEDGDITGRLLMLRDITEARLLEEQREDFTDMVIHDLRGPLGAVQNAMDLVLPRLSNPADEADNEVLIKASRENATRLLRLVETLLDVSRMQRPGLELQRETVDLRPIVDSAFAALITTAQHAGIQLHAELPPDLPLVRIDREKIERVLVNLLDNAVRYTPNGGEIRVTASVLEPDRWLEVRVADTGPGIPPERRTEIFERFRRIPGQQPRRGHRGHGLGLNFVKMAVERHGGTVRVVDGDVLPGACFVFTLPIAE